MCVVSYLCTQVFTYSYNIRYIKESAVNLLICEDVRLALHWGEFSKVDFGGKNQLRQTQGIFDTYQWTSPINVFKILVFITSSSSTMTGDWSHFLCIPLLDNPAMITP